MKIKINTQLLGIDNKAIDNGAGGTITLKDVCISSILSSVEGEEEKVKFEKYEIYKKLRDSKEEVELTIEELSVLKKTIGKFQTTLIMGQCFEILEK